jgi:hypothetical protein
MLLNLKTLGTNMKTKNLFVALLVSLFAVVALSVSASVESEGTQITQEEKAAFDPCKYVSWLCSATPSGNNGGGQLPPVDKDD